MTEALYRIYRPKLFADIVDQQHIRITLQHALEQDRVAHAYLFAGPRGIGKTTMARILARAVNCLKRKANGEPCNTCASCTAILQNANLDIIEIDAASQTGVDNVRENIIQSARSIPSMSKRKVFIIDEVHMLSTSAFNALLKLLEEPPAHAMFILATTEVHRIPETIISRTQRFDFKKVSIDDIVVRLQKITAAEKRQLDDDVARRIARRAGGSIRDAETMLGQLFSFEEKRITTDIADIVLPRSDQQLVLDVLDDMIHHRATEALNRFHDFCDEGGDIPNLVHEVIMTARALLLIAVDPTLIEQVVAEYDRSDIQRLNSLAQTTTVANLNQLIETWLTAQRRLHRAVMIEMPVELAIIVSADLTSVTPPDAEKIVPPAPRRNPPPAPPAPTGTESPKPSPGKKSKGSQLTLQAVREAWQAIQRSIGRTHPSLGLSIQHASIGDVNDQEVTLHVPFKLHADRISDPKYSGPLMDALTEALGQSVRLSVLIIDRPEEAPAPKPAPSPSVTPVSGLVPKPATVSPKKDLWDQVVSSFS